MTCWPVTTPTSTDRRHLRELFGYPWRARVTTAYVAIISATSLVLAGTSDRLNNAVLRSNSTNLNGLARNPVRVLITSALFLERGGYPLFLVTAVVVLAPLERWLSAWRALATFAVGHVGASLLVAAGLSIGVRAGQVAPSIARAMDVGPSYGTVACAAAFVYRFPWRWRIAGVVAAFAVVLVPLAMAPTPTAWGHVAAAAIGFGCYPLTRWRRGPDRP